ncbi:MAG: DUF2877 domain-containing protein [Kiritimatiellae bacterium]|nr:DUF2877 domain-containing protein [Kiritimatiellia bacterium]
MPPSLSIGQSLGDRIRPARYRLLSIHARSRIYLSLDEGAGDAPSSCPLFAVQPAIGAGPLNWILAPAALAALPDLLDFRPALPPAPLYDSALPPHAAALFPPALALIRRELPSLAPPDSLVSLFSPSASASLPPFQCHRDAFLAPHLPALRDSLRTPRLALSADAPLRAALHAFRGCGSGSTPSGDDFLSGCFLAHHLLHAAPPPAGWLAAALGHNPISNAFLTLAHAGRIHQPFRQFLLAPSLSTFRPLLHFGHTSGADLLAAFLLL